MPDDKEMREPHAGGISVTAKAGRLGAKVRAAKELIGEVGGIVEELKPILDELPGGSTTTGGSEATYACETSVPVTVEGTGSNSEEFWWNVEEHERNKYDPIQKDKAKDAAEMQLETKLREIRDFSCASPCKKFFNVTYADPVFDSRVVNWNFYTEVIWTCTITAEVTWGCKK